MPDMERLELRLKALGNRQLQAVGNGEMGFTLAMCEIKATSANRYASALERAVPVVTPSLSAVRRSEHAQSS